LRSRLSGAAPPPRPPPAPAAPVWRTAGALELSSPAFAGEGDQRSWWRGLILNPSDLPRIVFGCGNFGGIGSAQHLRSAGDSEEQALQLLDHARSVGLRRFDTANTYGGGASEIVLGKWLRSQGAAFVQSAQIATKVGNPHGCPPGETPLSRTQIAHHLDQSLRRLGIERIDLYYIHEFDRRTPLEETLAPFEDAVEAGKIDRFGISNASLADVKAVRDLAGSSLASRFEYVQNEFNLLATADAEGLIPYCAEHDLRYTAFSPLAGGFLTGKYRIGEQPPTNSRLAHAPEACADYASEESFMTIEQLRRSAEARRVKMAEAALRFVLDTPGLDSLMIAPRRVEHFATLGLRPK
jgi:aryl-alcohol dehydrogenase-like predicted oxidoreductase